MGVAKVYSTLQDVGLNPTLGAAHGRGQHLQRDTVCHLPADRPGCISTSSQAKFNRRKTQTGVFWATLLEKV